MPITLDEARALRDSLKASYSERHSDFKLLRKFWHGKYWEVSDAQENQLTSLFRDLPSNRQGSPEMLVVHNLLQEVCVKYQTYLCTLPQISVFVDPPGSQIKRAQSDKKERFLYGLWEMGNMVQKLSDISWYLPLFGHSFLGVFPDTTQKIPMPIVRSPEHAYPIMGFDGCMEGVIFSWKIPESIARRDFPQYKPVDQPKQRKKLLTGPFFGSSDDQGGVEVLEYSDNNCWYRWVGDTMVSGVEHNFGWNIFDEVKFISVPGEPWGHGAVEQSVGMVHLGNHLRSLLMHSVLENVFPVLHIDNPAGLPEEMDMGPGGVISTRDGGQVGWLTPPVQALATQMGFLGENEQAIKQATSMPDVNFGISHASIQTGKAINELQGAGTGSTVEMVQGVGIGNALVSWNQKAIEMTRQMFAEDSISLFGQRPAGMTEINPKRFALNLKGKELVGSPRNDVIFLPHLNLHEKTVMLLQQAGAGLVSKRFMRDNIGIPDSEAMEEEIAGEIITDAVMQGIAGSLQSMGDPAAATAAETQAVSYLAGATTSAPKAPAGAPPALAAPPGLPPSGGGGFPGGPPTGPLAPGATGQALSPALHLPPGSAPPALADASQAPPSPQGGAGGASLDQVAADIRAVDGIKGKLFLVGQLVQTGTTEGDIEVDITNPADEQTLRDSLDQYSLVVQTVSGPPPEPYVDVSPGSSGTKVQGAGQQDAKGAQPVQQ